MLALYKSSGRSALSVHQQKIRQKPRSYRLVTRALPFDINIPHVQLPFFEDVRSSEAKPLNVENAPPLKIGVTEFIRQVDDGRVKHVDIRQDGSALLAYDDGTGFRELVTLPYKFDVTSYLLAANVDMLVVQADESGSNFMNGLLIVIQVSIFLIILRSMFGGMGGGNPMGGIRDFAQGKSRVQVEPEIGTTFNDVAGAIHAKTDLREVVDFLKNPEKYDTVGAKVPRGVLLYGNPGTGKTLLAKAVAGEAGVPFISCSGSDFMEMFVGVGASRIRGVFAKAKELAPCIVFIDEIDTIGKKRGASGPGGNDERDQTINQLLTLMDGFETEKGNLESQIIVMAATNRLDILDEALLRPGRFDRKIYVELPDRAGREDILAIHTRGKPLAEDVSITSIANVTVGFSGADLENLANEAAIYAARVNASEITRAHFDAAFEKITIGEEKKTIIMTPEKKRLIAVHEAGHTLMALLLHEYDTVRKVTIVPRGQTGGTTWFEPTEDRIDIALMTREYFQHRIMVALGGRIAEEIIFGWDNVTTGASGDMQVVYQLANQMVTQFGFSRKVGPVNWQHHADERDVQNEIRTIVQELFDDASYKLASNRAALERLTEALLEKETLEQEEIIEVAAIADSY